MPSPESLIEMAQGPKAGKTGSKSESRASRPEKSPKTQEELHKTLEKRFGTLVGDTKVHIDTYKQMIKDGDFEDGEDEEAGAGDKRKELAQTKIEDLMNRVDKMKKTLDSKVDLPQTTPTIEVEYSLTNPKTKKIERQETITLDIEKKTQEFLDFYTKTGVDLPSDFTETISDIWERNGTEIQQAIKENGFDDVLLVPANISLPELADKMKMGNGYYTGSNFDSGGGFAGATSQNVDKPRLVLIHKTQNLKDRPELAKTLNIKGQDVKLDQIPTLEDYLVFQRKYFEETTKHLDEIGATWLATKSGARLVDSYWGPGDGGLSVDANDLGSRDEYLGARPSRSFF